MNLPPYLQVDGSGAVRLLLWVQTGARESGFAGRHERRLKVRLKSRPVEGRANRELLSFLAAALGVSPAQVELIAGPASRAKTVRITGLAVERLPAPLREC